MEVAVTHFEDYTEPTGEILTKYMLRVLYKPPGESKEGNGSKICYMLGKRYSDFKSLHSEARDLIPSDYKFPNKSIFNNNATFTKERRIRGFDELIKLLMKSTEGFVLLKEFVEIEQRLEQHRTMQDRTMQDHHSPAAVVAPVSSSSSRLSAAKEQNNSSEILESSPHHNSGTDNNNQPSLSSTSHKPNDVTAFPEEMITRRELQKQSLFLQQRQAEAISHLGDSLAEEEETHGHSSSLSSDDLLRSRGFKTHFLFALKAVMIFYLIISLLGIVEVASLSQALLTLVSLTVLAMLINLQIDRLEISKEEDKQTAVSKGN